MSIHLGADVLWNCLFALYENMWLFGNKDNDLEHAT